MEKTDFKQITEQMKTYGISHGEPIMINIPSAAMELYLMMEYIGKFFYSSRDIEDLMRENYVKL